MPIDPSVLLYGLQPQARTPYDAPDVVAERRAHVEQLREQAKAKQDAEYENQLYDWAVKSNLGPDGTPDFEGVRKSLAQVAPRYLQKFDAAMNTAKKSQAETYKLEDDHNEADAKTLAQWAQGITPENYGDRLDFLQKRRPDLAAKTGLPATYDPIAVPTRVQTLTTAATTIADYNKNQDTVRSLALDGKFDEALAHYIDRQGPNFKDDKATAEGLENLFHQLANLGASPTTIQGYRDRGINDLRDTFTPNTLTTPAQRTQADVEKARLNLEAIRTAGEVAGRAQTATDRAQAEADRQAAAKALADWRDKQYGLQQRTASRADAQLAMKQRSAAAGLDPDAVAGWVQHVMDNGTFVGVPANVKNQVMGELKRLNVNVQDLTNADLTRRNVARTIEPKIEAVKEMAKQIDQMGLTGTLGGRWRKIVSGETAASDLTDLTPAQKQLVGKFATEASGLLLSGIAMAHGGARGGGSPQLLEQIKQYLDPGNKDLNVYLGNLDGAKEFIHGYATMGTQAPRKTGGGGAYTGEVRKTADGRTIGRVNGQTVEVVETSPGSKQWVVK
jgi:hypothetical protein